MRQNEPVELSPAQRRRVLFATCFALVLVVASVSSLNVALPDIGRHFAASQSELQWIIDAYALLLAALLLPAGALGDRFGRRGALIVGLVLFAVMNAASAYAGSSTTLIVLRAAAGIGAALIMPGTLSTITSIFPPEERARALGVWVGFAGVGGILGLVASGALLEQFWWGSIFVGLTILSVLALAATIAFVPNTRDPEPPPLDGAGGVLAFVAIATLVFAVIEGPSRGWGDTLVLTAFATSVVAAVVFVLWELRSAAPMLDPRLFRHRGFSTSTAALVLLFLSLFGVMLVVMQYFQFVLGYGTFKTSLAILPMAFVMMPLAAVSAVLARRFGMRVVAGTGIAIGAVGFGLIARLDTTSGYLDLLLGVIVVGIGLALAMTPATDAIVESLPLEKQGVASAVNDVARELGAAIGIAVMGSAFNSGYRADIGEVTRGLPGDLAALAHDAPAGALAAASQLGADGARVVAGAQEAFMAGLRVAALVAMGLLVVGALYVWLRSPARVAHVLDGEPADDVGVEPTVVEVGFAVEPDPAGSAGASPPLRWVAARYDNPEA